MRSFEGARSRSFGSELEQQPERVPVSSYGILARTELL